MTEETGEKKFTLRIPDAQHEYLGKVAKSNKRSLNSEILILIEEGLAARKRPVTVADLFEGQPDDTRPA